MRNFEHRIALPKVLDHIHRKTITATLGMIGVRVSGESWQEIDDTLAAHPKVRRRFDGYDLDSVEYGDDMRVHDAGEMVGELFGQPYQLLMSETTPYLDETLAGVSRSEHIYQRRLGLWSGEVANWMPDFTSLYLLRDMPPVVVRGGVIIEVGGERLDIQGLESIPDGEIIETARKDFGNEGVIFIDEDFAHRAIRALMKDRTRTFHIDFYSK